MIAEIFGLVRMSASFTVLTIILSVVTLAAFIWAAFIRKPGRPHHHHHHHHRHHWRHSRSETSDDTDEKTDDRSSGFLGRKRRRRRKKERKANPTLAETGGLPPVRSNESEPPNN